MWTVNIKALRREHAWYMQEQQGSLSKLSWGVGVGGGGVKDEIREVWHVPQMGQIV